MLAVFKRELKSYFTNPLGFIVLAAFYFFLGLGFLLIFSAGSPNMAETIFFTAQIGILYFIIPVITMRLFSDERRQKTDQALFTAPVKLIHIVLGKFFAAFVLYAMGFLPTIIFQIIVSGYKASASYFFYYVYALLGIMLFGGALIAIGMFISSLTESPIISIIFTLIANLFIMFSGAFAGMISIPTTTNGVFSTIGVGILKAVVAFLNGMNFLSVLESFGEQSFAIKDVIFFLSIIAAFIFLTERSLEKRRWS